MKVVMRKSELKAICEVAIKNIKAQRNIENDCSIREMAHRIAYKKKYILFGPLVVIEKWLSNQEGLRLLSIEKLNKRDRRLAKTIIGYIPWRSMTGMRVINFCEDAIEYIKLHNKDDIEISDPEQLREFRNAKIWSERDIDFDNGQSLI
jgi:hypothetical protein